MNSDPASLDRLHDIIVPPAVPWWPPAPGWYWVLGLLLILFLVVALRGFLRWQSNRYRREAVAEWHHQAALLSQTSGRLPALVELAVLLKRTALSVFPRTEIAALTGPAWLAFLDRTAAMQGFASEAGALLERVTYQSLAVSEVSENQARAAANLVRQWIERHHVELPRRAADEGPRMETRSKCEGFLC